MTLGEAQEDLDAIGALPGRKLLLRGNHDYWWSSISRVRDALAPGMFAIQNDAVFLGGALFAGSRGWTSLSGEAADEKIRQREKMRLEMSLQSGARVGRGRAAVCDDALSAAFPGRSGE